jgi:hypothetical protein
MYNVARGPRGRNVGDGLHVKAQQPPPPADLVEVVHDCRVETQQALAYGDVVEDLQVVRARYE